MGNAAETLIGVGVGLVLIREAEHIHERHHRGRREGLGLFR